MASPLYFETITVAELIQRGLCCEAARVSAPAQEESGEATVLVVDDERMIADTMALILNGNGFHAVVAYDGQSALELVRAAPPQIMITDVMMPGMNGVQLAIAVRDSWPDCRILLFSGNIATQDLVETARQNGYQFEFLSKPIHPEGLLRRLSAPRLTDEAA